MNNAVSGISGLRVLLAPNPSPMTLDGTRTFVIGRDRPAVIDPGPDKSRHFEAILHALQGTRPAAILLTHIHPDHAALAPALARRTGAPLWLAPGALLTDPIPVNHPIREGDTVETDAGPLRAIATPGHAPEHTSFFWEGAGAPVGGALFVGDLLMGEGDTTLVAPPEGDLSLYLQSLERVRELSPGILFPAHGPPLGDPAAALDRYTRHRSERIEQALAALRRTGSARPGELVEVVYGPELHPALAAAAEGSLTAILQFLVQSDRARAGGGSYSVVE